MTRQFLFRSNLVRSNLVRTLQVAALAATVTLLLSSMAAAYDRDDDDYHRGSAAQTRDYGYQNGYNDGLRKGRHEGKENDPYDFRSRDWQRADHGYKSWMGPFESFREGYRDGYRSGFEEGFRSVHGWEGDRDHDGDRWRGENVAFRSSARDIGFQDGCAVARQDMISRKPFDPYPRSGYANADHGYHSSYGSKVAYQAEYSDGYRAGYQSVFRSRY